jgi:hypothetical protein
MGHNGEAALALQHEYEAAGQAFAAQTPLTQRFVESQARALAEAIVQHAAQARFRLPDQVVDPADQSRPLNVPADQREQVVGGAGLFDRLSRNADVRKQLRVRLGELEQSPQPAVVVSARLLRYATAMYMVRGLLPSGRSVTYVAAEDEEIPTLPVAGLQEPESAITAATDAIVEEGQSENGRGELQVPYATAARRFYLPQWVAFDDQDQLLVNTLAEAEAHLASMQRYMEILHLARAFAPYIVADEDYQHKRYGMLGQLINQGRALARYQTRDIIATIRSRAARGELNRGLSLSLPYFNDQTLELQLNNFEVIPAGRIMFVPAFVVRAAQEEQAKVAEDTRLNASTRQHLLAELQMLEAAFDTGAQQAYRALSQSRSKANG